MIIVKRLNVHSLVIIVHRIVDFFFFSSCNIFWRWTVIAHFGVIYYTANEMWDNEICIRTIILISFYFFLILNILIGWHDIRKSNHTFEYPKQINLESSFTLLNNKPGSKVSIMCSVAFKIKYLYLICKWFLLYLHILLK